MIGKKSATIDSDKIECAIDGSRQEEDVTGGVGESGRANESATGSSARRRKRFAQATVVVKRPRAWLYYCLEGTVLYKSWEKARKKSTWMQLCSCVFLLINPELPWTTTRCRRACSLIKFYIADAKCRLQILLRLHHMPNKQDYFRYCMYSAVRRYGDPILLALLYTVNNIV